MNPPARILLLALDGCVTLGSLSGEAVLARTFAADLTAAVQPLLHM